MSKEIFGMKVRITKACPKDRIIFHSDNFWDEVKNEITPERIAVIKIQPPMEDLQDAISA